MHIYLFTHTECIDKLSHVLISIQVEEMKRSNITPDSAVTYTVDIPFDDVTGTPIGGGVFAL